MRKTTNGQGCIMKQMKQTKQIKKWQICVPNTESMTLVDTDRKSPL